MTIRHAPRTASTTVPRETGARRECLPLVSSQLVPRPRRLSTSTRQGSVGRCEMRRKCGHISRPARTCQTAAESSRIAVRIPARLAGSDPARDNQPCLHHAGLARAGVERLLAVYSAGLIDQLRARPVRSRSCSSLRPRAADAPLEATGYSLGCMADRGHPRRTMTIQGESGQLNPADGSCQAGDAEWRMGTICAR
jgi:hypothetical protein